MSDFDYEIDTAVFLSKSNFSAYIENMVLENKGMTYFDAVLKFSYDSDKDADELLKYMSPVLLEKIKKSAVDLELIRPDNYSLEDLTS